MIDLDKEFPSYLPDDGERSWPFSGASSPEEKQGGEDTPHRGVSLRCDGDLGAEKGGVGDRGAGTCMS